MISNSATPASKSEMDTRESSSWSEPTLSQNDGSSTESALGIVLPILLFALLGVLVRMFLYSMKGTSAWLWFGAALCAGIGGIFLIPRWNLFRLLRSAWMIYGVFLGLTICLPVIGSVILGRTPEESGMYQLLRYSWLLFPPVYGLMLYRLRGLGISGILAALFLLCVPLLVCARLFWSGLYVESLAAFACLGMLLLAIRAGFFNSRRWAAMLFVILVILMLGAVLLIVEPYRLSRFLAVINPARDPMGDGWIVLRMRELLSHAQILGAGEPLPMVTQEIVDSFAESAISQSVLLAMIAYRYGLVAAALPIIGFGAWMIGAGRKIGTMHHSLGKLVAGGVLLVFAAQLILSGALFLGYPLWYSAVFPFLSDDTMAYLMNLLLAGVLVSLFRMDGHFQDTLFQNKTLKIRFE